MAIIVRVKYCLFCDFKSDNDANLSKHVKTIHEISHADFYELLLKQEIISNCFCSKCKKIIDFSHLSKLTYSQVMYYSFKDKITCSCGCSKSLSSEERMLNHPEFGQRFTLLNKSRKGKSYDECFGKIKGDSIKDKISLKTSGEKNANFGGKYCRFEGVKKYARMNFTQRYGDEKALLVKNKLSVLFKGEKNPMYGKPSPAGSGVGWKGWYNGFFFRSLLELSFLIENNTKHIETAEKSSYKISYLNYAGEKRSYFPDFKIDNVIYECKPKALWSSKENILKFEAAKKFCLENNFSFVVVEPTKLTNEKILELYLSDKIKFLDKYEKKFKERFMK